MPIEVEGPDGAVLEFPDGTPRETIQRAMQQRYGGGQPSRRATDPSTWLQTANEIGAPSVDPSTWLSTASRVPEDLRVGEADRARARQRRRGDWRRRRDNSTDADLRASGVPQWAIPAARGLQSLNRSLDWTDQIGHNVGYRDELNAGGAYVLQGGENLIRRARGQPVEVSASAAAQAAADESNERGAQFAQDNPGQDMLATAASIPLFLGNPVAAAPRLGALQAGGIYTALNAPFALARQDGDLAERLPGAAQESAVVFGLGAGLQGLANRLTRAPRPNSAGDRLRRFEDAGVRPTAAAVHPAAAGPTKMISENFLAGGGTRARLQASLDDTRDAAGRISQGYGQANQTEQIGETVQRAVTRFAQDADARPPSGGRPETVPSNQWSFRAKANALYERVFRTIEADEAAHLAGQTGARAQATATQAALRSIQTRVTAPALADVMSDPTIARIAQALEQDAGRITFADLRALRTWVRELRRKPGLTQSVDEASLARLESALTEDIYTSAHILAGPAAAQQLRRVDRYYRAGLTRIQQALEPFTQGGGAQAYQRIISLAREGGRQNSRTLAALRQSMRPEEWREVAATVVDDMGRVSPGHPGALEAGAFSVERFVTNYARLSREGRRILFGGAGTENLAAALDNLAHVAGYQKGVEAMANRSRSGVNVQNVGTGALLLNPSSTGWAALGVAMMAITGEMLTNPAFVRWLARAGQISGGMRRQLAQLATLAARDPAIAPFYDSLVRNAAGQLLPAGDQSQPRQAQPQARMQPAQ